MPRQSRETVTAFQGRISQANPHLIPTGAAQKQDNAVCVVPGQLDVRLGLTPITFENGEAVSASDLISAANFSIAPARLVVYEQANGTVRAGRNPSIASAGNSLGAPSILTGLNAFQPLSFAATRHGKLLMANGIDGPRVWNGLTAAPWTAGVVAPTAAHTVTLGASGGATEGEYVSYYRYKTTDGIYSNLSPITISNATDGQKFTHSAFTLSGNTRVTHIEIYRSTSGQSEVVYLVTTVANSGTPSYEDTLSDDALSANTALPILNNDGSLSANRFGVPPDHKAVIVQFQDRAFWGVDVAYNVGTAAVTNGSATVTGTSTAWTSQMAGRYFYIAGQTVGYLISAASATSLTLSTTYAGSTTSGNSYTIKPGPDERNKIFYSAVDEPESVPSTNVVVIQENTGDDDEIVGLVSAAAFLYVLKDRHVYQLDFVRQPTIDVGVNLIAWRGALNQRCWCMAEGTAYVMDSQGIYRLGDGIDPVGEPLQDLFRTSTSANSIDFSKSKWFHAQVHHAQNTLKFHVAFTGDSGTYPKRALCYNYRDGQWWTESYPWEIGANCPTVISGRARVVKGSEDGLLLLADQGTLDGLDSASVSGTTRGTATAATSTTLSDSTATFPSDVATNQAAIAIVSGTGKWQLRRVVTRNSATQLTVDTAWTTTPDTTSVYQLGAIEWLYKTGIFRFTNSAPDRATEEVQRAIRLWYQPTAGDAALDLRRYLNHESTAENNRITHEQGDGLSVTNNDPDAVVNLKRTRSAQSNQPGFARYGFDSSQIDETQTDRWLTAELRGYQGSEQLTVYKLELDGVDRG